MHITRWIGSTLLIAISLLLGSPAPARANQNWLPINPSDLTLKDNPASPGSDAMILYREEILNEPRNLRSEYDRIKIFTQKGKQWGNVEIPYDPDYEGIESIHARTILPTGAVVPFTGKVYDKIVVKAGGVQVYEKSFSLPDVQPGCIIEYAYDAAIEPDHYLSLIDLDVQRDLFTREAKFAFVPISDIDETGKGYYGWRTLFLPNTDKPLWHNGSYLLVVHNVPALKREPYMLPEEMIRGRLEFFYVNHGNTPPKKYWKEQGKKWDRQLSSFINRKKVLDQALATIVQKSGTPEAKLEKIYARVQKIRNLSFEPSMSPQVMKQEGIVSNRNVEDVLKHGYGTWQDVNDLFVGLARAAGMDATLIYLAPRDRVMFVPAYEDPDELQTNVVEVKAGSQTWYLDPSSPQYPFGLLPWPETGVPAMLLTKDGGEVISVPGADAGQAQILRRTKIILGADGSLTGTIEVDYTGQEAAIRRQADRNDDETGRRKALHDEIQDWLPEGATFQITQIENWNDTSKPLRVEGTLKFPPFGNRMYGGVILPLSFYGSALTSSFTSTERVNDIYFHFPFQVLDDTSIHLPSGIRVESLPKVPGLARGAIQYQIVADAQAGTVHITRKLAVNGIAYPVKYYPAIRTIFRLAKAGDAQDIVLESTVAARQK
ncbi:MAG TPA: DUF3857 domain-containing protein [Patescibacteria group bacterium]|nr:DUF3857 domain-containing protein [Patescibacteria group bacterium]